MDVTQWIGVLTFGTAAAVCLITVARPWPLLGLINAALAIECALDWRHSLHSSIASLIDNVYSGRSLPQLLVIGVAVAVAVMLLLQMRGGEDDHSNSGAATATLAAALLFLLDTAAPRGVEALLHRPALGLLVIGWLWLLVGSIIVIAALLAARRTGVSRR